MKYYETEIGLFSAETVPAGAVELTQAAYEERLAYIRAHAVHVPAEPFDSDEEDLPDGDALQIITGGDGT